MTIETRFAFAVVAIEKDFITMEQAKEAMDIQVTEGLEGKGHRLIGEILVSQGYMTETQIDEVLLERIR